MSRNLGKLGSHADDHIPRDPRMWSTIVGMWSTIVGSSTTFGTRTIVGTDYPRSVTHPDVSAVPWHNHSSSFRIGSGCTNQDCTGGGASASIPNGPLYKCWGPLKVPIGAGKLHRFLPEVDMGLVHHMILFAGRCGSRLIYAWARTGQASGTHPLRARSALRAAYVITLTAPSLHPPGTLPAPRACAQTAPIGLDFDSWDPAAGYGYPLGSSAAGGMPPLTHVSLQIHYQQTSHMPTTDRSGLRIWYTEEPTPTPNPSPPEPEPEPELTEPEPEPARTRTRTSPNPNPNSNPNQSRFSPLPPRLPLTLNINVRMPAIL